VLPGDGGDVALTAEQFHEDWNAGHAEMVVRRETVVRTGKIAALGKFSREQLAQPRAAEMVVKSMQRAVVKKADTAFLSNATDPTGLPEVVGIEPGGEVGDDLDTLADAVTHIEADGGTATHIIAAPDAWGPVAKLKTGTGSAQSLLGAGTEPVERRLLGVPVLTSSAMPSGNLLVIDASQVLAVYGAVQVARSEDVLFVSDVVAVRVTWRVGFNVMRPGRVVQLTTTVAPE
jgi:HK97 family phage major capsid protein